VRVSTAADGSAVEPYTLLPELGEGASVAEVVTTGGAILERITGGVAHDEASHLASGRSWRHPLTMRIFADRVELERALAEAALALERRLDGEDGRWLVAAAR
jgi:hypothetical protein